MVDWNRYAHERKDMNYYKAVKREIFKHSPGASILDVGCGGTDLVMTGEFKYRVAVNTEPIRMFDTALIVGRWPNIDLPLEKFDVVLCCQVIEHLEDNEIEPFVAKLKAVANNLIVSLPYYWTKGVEQSHKQDPVTDIKLKKWLGIPKRSRIIKDQNLRRIVLTF